MKLPNIIAVGAALLALAGCQAAGTSTYGGSISEGSKVARSQTVLKKVGKVRRVKQNGDVYYVNKYVRVKRKSKKSTVTSSYAPKRTSTKTTRALKKAVKKTKIARKTKTVKRSKARGGSKNIDALIAKHAKANGVPVRLARAVVQVESAGRVNARGAAGEIGLMQIMPRTARGMGYKGKMKSLYNPDKNLAYGMKYLGEAYRRGGKTTCGAILKYNAGHYAKRWNPTSRKYCKRVKGMLKKG